jgi:uncharacterized membrane protein YhiD involved in acid resistance
MFAPDVTNTVLHWPFLPTLVRLSLALGTGAFVGLEREHRGKAGARTFTFASLIGCLGGLLGNSYALLAITVIGLFVCFLNFREWKLHQSLLLTTSAALIIVGFCGVLCGKGHTFTPVATAVITAAILAWKQPITAFATGLSDIELRSAVRKRGIPHRKSEQVLAFPHDPETARSNLQRPVHHRWHGAFDVLGRRHDEQFGAD